MLIYLKILEGRGENIQESDRFREKFREEGEELGRLRVFEVFILVSLLEKIQFSDFCFILLM